MAKKFIEEVGTLALRTVRNKLVHPFLDESEQAKKWGWLIKKGQLVETVAGIGRGFFPTSIREDGDELSRNIAVAHNYLLNKSVCRAMLEEKEIYKFFEDTNLPNPIPDIWKLECTRYLWTIARSADDALEMFVKDDNPYKLYCAIVALSNLYGGGTDDNIEDCLVALLNVHDRMHEDDG